MKLRFSRRATADIANIRSFIARDNEAAADRVATKINTAIDRLRDFPRLGCFSRSTEVMELRVPRIPYVVVYEIDPVEIFILRVYHLAQDRPR